MVRVPQEKGACGKARHTVACPLITKIATALQSYSAVFSYSHFEFVKHRVTWSLDNDELEQHVTDIVPSWPRGAA